MATWKGFCNFLCLYPSYRIHPDKVKSEGENFMDNKVTVKLCPLKITAHHKWGKIHWAKYSWFQPCEVFYGNTFVVHWPPVFITYLKAKNSWEIFCGKLKNRKSLVQRIFPCLRYMPNTIQIL